MSELDINQKALAERTGIDEGVISRYVNDQRKRPGARELANIAKALNLSLSWLYDESGPKRFGATAEAEVSFSWPSDTPEEVRIAVQQQVLVERELHRRALIPYWVARMEALLAELTRRRG